MSNVLIIGSELLFKYPQWIKELNLEGPSVPKFLVGTMADMKNEVKDKSNVPTKRFVKTYSATVLYFTVLPTNYLFDSEVQKTVKDLNFVTSMECR